MSVPSYPPPTKRRQSASSQDSRSHSCRRSSTSNVNTLVNPHAEPGGSAQRPHGSTPPPTAYAPGRGPPNSRATHRPGRSSFSMSSTAMDSQSSHIPPSPHSMEQRFLNSGSPVLSKQPPNLPPTKGHEGGPFMSQHPSQPPPQFETQLREKQTCCGVVEQSIERAREDRYGEQADLKPQPWAVLKMMIPITFGIIGYAGYVYVGVLVVPMLRQSRKAEGSRTEGIGLLVGFSILYSWMIWAYIKVISTSPGYARGHVALTPKPPCIAATVSAPSPRPSQTLSFATTPGRRPSQDSRYTLGPTDATRNIAGPSYEELSQNFSQGEGTSARAGQSLDLTRRAEGATSALERSHSQPKLEPKGKNVSKPPLVGRTTSNMTIKSLARDDSDSESEAEPERRPRESRASLSLKGVLDGAREVDVEAAVSAPTAKGRLKRKRGGAENALVCCWWLADDRSRSSRRTRSVTSLSTSGVAKPRTYISRRPPMTPFLDPFIRYCDKDGFVKPHRAHHCRSCGTCVLKFDHHCPWIGQCVGARNHKFFLNFCQAACLCCLYIVGSVTPFMARGFSEIGRDIQIQEIVVVALAALFSLFTFTLVVSHTHMIMLGRTTVEHMQIETLKEREAEQLGKAYRFWQLRGKRRTVEEWDREWGRLGTEGHIWWIGGKRREWEAVMGKNVWGWFLPIGRGEGDGVVFPVNPRFEPGTGRWRRREDWPKELR